MLQKKIKAVVAFVGTLVTSLVAFYNVNQNMTLKEFLSSLVAAVVTAVAVHQSPANKV